jgi:hypothetical protein
MKTLWSKEHIGGEMCLAVILTDVYDSTSIKSSVVKAADQQKRNNDVMVLNGIASCKYLGKTIQIDRVES